MFFVIPVFSKYQHAVFLLIEFIDFDLPLLYHTTVVVFAFVTHTPIILVYTSAVTTVNVFAINGNEDTASVINGSIILVPKVLLSMLLLLFGLLLL